MKALTKVGLVGCGSIGATIVDALYKDSSINAKIVYLFDRESGKAGRLKAQLEKKLEVVSSFEDLINAPF